LCGYKPAGGETLNDFDEVIAGDGKLARDFIGCEDTVRIGSQSHQRGAHNP
jgi:hypothetical protein